MRALVSDLGLMDTDAVRDFGNPSPTCQAYTAMETADAALAQPSWHALQFMMLRSGHVASDAQQLRTHPQANPSTQTRCQHCGEDVLDGRPHDAHTRWRRVAHHMLTCKNPHRDRSRSMSWLYATLNAIVRVAATHPLHAVFEPFIRSPFLGPEPHHVRRMLTFLLNPGAVIQNPAHRRRAALAVARFLAHDFAAQDYARDHGTTMAAYLWDNYPVGGVSADSPTHSACNASGDNDNSDCTMMNASSDGSLLDTANSVALWCRSLQHNPARVGASAPRPPFRASARVADARLGCGVIHSIT